MKGRGGKGASHGDTPSTPCSLLSLTTTQLPLSSSPISTPPTFHLRKLHPSPRAFPPLGFFPYVANLGNNSPSRSFRRCSAWSCWHRKAGFPRLTVRDKVDPGPATQVPPGSLLRRKTPGSHLKPQSQIWHFSKILWEFICILAFEKQKSKRC